MIHIVWISYCKTATWFTVRFIHLVTETVLDFFWFSLCKFASFFAYYFSLNAFAPAFWCILLFFFLLFVHACVLLILLWLATLSACLMQPPLSKVNKCMCILVGWYQTQTLKEANLLPRLNQRPKKIPKRSPKKEKISKTRQIRSPKGKKLHVSWLVFFPVFALTPCLHPNHPCHFCKQQIFCVPRITVPLKVHFPKTKQTEN